MIDFVLPALTLLSSQQSFFAPERSLGAAAPLLNHGPSTSGGGSSVVSGETLRAGRWSLDWRTEYTSYEHISAAEAEEIAEHGGHHFDALERSFLSTFALAYGIHNDLQVSAQVGFYRGENFLNAEPDGMGGAESHFGDPSGLTDLWINGKYRLSSGPRGHFSVLAGVKLATGADDETLENGEVLEPSSQPGTGATDWQAGFAYSRYLDPATTFDASLAFTGRGEEDDFQVGDRTDLGVAIARQLSGDSAAAPGWTAFGELLVVVLKEDREGDEFNENSGGTTLFLTPGLRYRFANGMAATLAPSFPVRESLNGEQIETDLKVILVVSFDW